MAERKREGSLVDTEEAVPIPVEAVPIPVEALILTALLAGANSLLFPSSRLCSLASSQGKDTAQADCPAWPGELPCV